MAVAAAQATLNIRVPHYLVIDQSDLGALVDRLNGIEVDAEAAFKSGSLQLGPGVVRLLGSDVIAYLTTATDPDDLTARWEDVLTGLMAGPDDAGRAVRRRPVGRLRHRPVHQRRLQFEQPGSDG
jgi:anionic cell wall polymer biosynthesis LytR-Cps2A-Psr (LCP) family protein